MLQRIAKLFRGFFGLFVSGLEKRNPEALIEVEKEHLRRQIAEFNKGLAAHAGFCERMMAQVKRLEEEEEALRATTAAQLRAGNREVAGRDAYRLKGIKAQLEESRKQLEDAERTYRELIQARDTSVRAAKDKIDQLRRDVDDMKMRRALAELNEMTAGLVGDIGGSGDTLNRLHEMVQEERHRAAGRTRFARDSVDRPALENLEQERKALEELALADFAAESGLSLPETASGEVPEAGEGGTAGRTM